jgi:hypothetical protein
MCSFQNYLGSGSLLVKLAASIVTGWSEPVPGWVYLSPTEKHRVVTAHRKNLFNCSPTRAIRYFRDAGRGDKKARFR